MDEKYLPEQFYAARRDDSVVVLEGFHALKHAVRFGADIICAVSPRPNDVVALCKHHAPESVAHMRTLITPISETIYARLAPRPPRTGVIAIAKRPQYTFDILKDVSAPIVLIDDARDLDNLGACVRVAAAYGVAGVCVYGPLNPWRPACLRGSAGLHFAVPVISVSLDDVRALRRPVCVFDENGDSVTRITIPQKSILVFGSERAGVSHAMRELARQTVRIPMRDKVSSLNLATSVAAALYGGRYV